MLRSAGNGAQSQRMVTAEGDRKRPLSLRGGNGVSCGTAGGDDLLQVVRRRLLLPAGGEGCKSRICRRSDTVLVEEGKKSVFTGGERRAAHGTAGGAAAQLQRGCNKRKPHSGYLPFGVMVPSLNKDIRLLSKGNISV